MSAIFLETKIESYCKRKKIISHVYGNFNIFTMFMTQISLDQYYFKLFRRDVQIFLYRMQCYFVICKKCFNIFSEKVNSSIA